MLGAGASRPAGIPTIDEMTKDFLDNPLRAQKGDPRGGFFTTIYMDSLAYSQKFHTLSDIVLNYYGRSDLELIMSFLVQLEDPKLKSLFENKYPELKSLFTISDIAGENKIEFSSLLEFKQLIEHYVRARCEKIDTIEYFIPFKGLKSDADSLDIFTLNYDGTIEIFCEKNNIRCVDGFDPNWNPKNFNENKDGVNLYKLHGSLYWFKSKSGKYIKIPIKGLRIADMRYLTDETVSEMMIYPKLEKDKQSAIYSWLSQKFKEELNSSDACVIIGYSFRDDDLKNNIIESILSNPNLWLVIVSPNASNDKRKHFSNNDEIASRIVSMNMKIEEVLSEKKLYTYLNILNTARNQEQKTLLNQHRTQHRLDLEWYNILQNYLGIKHDDRIKWLVEELLKGTYFGISGQYHQSLEYILCSRSLLYMMEYYLDHNKEKLKLWKKFFVDACTDLEYMYFQSRQNRNPAGKKFNPVSNNEASQIVKSSSLTGMESVIEQLKDESNTIILRISDDKLKTCFSKFVQTLDLLSNKVINEYGYTSYIEPELQVVIDSYTNNDLGIKKWATEIINNLN